MVLNMLMQASESGMVLEYGVPFSTLAAKLGVSVEMLFNNIHKIGMVRQSDKYPRMQLTGFCHRMKTSCWQSGVKASHFFCFGINDT